MELLLLSTSRDILTKGSRDHERMRLYAGELPALHLVVLTRREHGFSGESIHEGNLHMHPTHSRSRFLMLWDAFWVSVRILKERPCMLSTQDPIELGFIAVLLSKAFSRPLNVQVHGDYFGGAWAHGSWFQAVRLVTMKWVLRRADSIRVVSLRIKESLEKIGIPESKIKTLPIRPELERFLGTSRNESKDTFTILTASRFSPEKNIDRLIRSFAAFAQAHSHSVLRIVGRGKLQDSFETLARSLKIEKNIQFIPWTESIEEEMARAHVFALASKHEAYGLVLIEALATGTPVVTTDVGCVGEVIEDGVHGLVVRGESDTAFTHALTEIYENEAYRKKAGEAGKALAQKLSLVSPKEYAMQWVAAHTAV